jgi:hypothetical protein
LGAWLAGRGRPLGVNYGHLLYRRQTGRRQVVLRRQAGGGGTERSTVNWCQPNRTGIARLDSYFDLNERRYYISPQSAEQAITEEKAKAAKNDGASESIGSVPQDAELAGKPNRPSANESRVKELERENLDLKIANRGKDYLIEQMQKERNGFFDQLLTANRKVGESETKLLQIETSTDTAAG